MFRAFILSIPILALILGIGTGYKLSRGPVSMILLSILCSGLYFAGLCLLAINGLALLGLTFRALLDSIANIIQGGGHA